jgi:Ca2+-binding RTX toxin-like protein
LRRSLASGTDLDDAPSKPAADQFQLTHVEKVQFSDQLMVLGPTTTLNTYIFGGAETLTFVSAGDFHDVGKSLDNTIASAAGNDTLDGGVGDDTLITFVGSGDFHGVGNSLDNTITGATGNDTLEGGAGDDALYGMGGADTMIGGAGNDTYIVDSSFDQVLENAGEGADTVYASASYALRPNVENLNLQGTGDFQAIGNDLVNTIVANSGNNYIDGGAGADYMVGGAGNDFYIVDNSFDQIVENAGEGTDSVSASASYALRPNVENLYLQGSGNINGFGNAVNNYIQGNSGDNVLDGQGGSDTMIGGAGNDVYFVDSSFDQIAESVGEGTDTVYAGVSYQLGNNVEYLYLQGSGNINGFGNSVGNYIQGNSGDNGIDGGGGADSLIGGAGNDLFIFRNGQANGDTVYDFAGHDGGGGDSFQFVGFGTAEQGATFTQVEATNVWQIHSGLDAHNEFITLNNSASVHASDYFFT